MKNTAATISSETEELYERQYEDRLDPFASFSRRERQRKLAQLGPFERITYSMVGRIYDEHRIPRRSIWREMRKLTCALSLFFFLLSLLNVSIFLYWWITGANGSIKSSSSHCWRRLFFHTSSLGFPRSLPFGIHGNLPQRYGRRMRSKVLTVNLNY